MATIRASCGDCGDVELTTRDVEVRVCTTTIRARTHFAARSDLVVSKLPNPASSNCSWRRVSGWHLVLCRPSSPSPAPGEPITHDDLLDFHTLMQREDWIESLNRSTRPS